MADPNTTNLKALWWQAAVFQVNLGVLGNGGVGKGDSPRGGDSRRFLHTPGGLPGPSELVAPARLGQLDAG